MQQPADDHRLVDAPPLRQQYGQPPNPSAYAYGPPSFPAQGGGNGIGIAGGVVGIVAAALFWFPYLGLTLGIIAVVLGSVGLKRANSTAGASKGITITGIVCGSFALVVGLLFVVLLFGTSFHSGAA